MHDEIGPIGDQCLASTGNRESRRPQVNRKGSRRRGRKHHVMRPQMADRLAADAAIPREPLDEFATDHAGRAKNQYPHRVPHSAKPPSTR